MLEYLPYEVLLEILHRLPVKSLIQFRCVSKSYNSLITCLAFVNSSLTRSHFDSHKLIVRNSDVTSHPHVERYKLIHEEVIDNNDSSSEQIQDIEFPLRSSQEHFQLAGFANGLFCLYEEDRIILWNPCIRKFITLPEPSDTGIFTCYLTFGFDLRTNDYKVVRIAHLCPSLAEVYSVSEGCWRITSGGYSHLPTIIIRNRGPAAYLNGAVYFMANDWGNAHSSIVLSLDLGDEVFPVISLPNGKFGSHADTVISVFKGLLSLICYEQEQRQRGRIYRGIKCCSIWVMKEYGVVDSWTKLLTIDLNMQYWRVLGFQENDHVLVQKIQSPGSMLVI